MPENHRDPIRPLLVRDRIIDDLAEVPVPLFAARSDIPPLVRCTHLFLSSVAGTIGPAAILPAFPAQSGEAFAFINERFDLA